MVWWLALIVIGNGVSITGKGYVDEVKVFGRTFSADDVAEVIVMKITMMLHLISHQMHQHFRQYKSASNLSHLGIYPEEQTTQPSVD